MYNFSVNTRPESFVLERVGVWYELGPRNMQTYLMSQVLLEREKNLRLYKYLVVILVC